MSYKLVKTNEIPSTSSSKLYERWYQYLRDVCVKTPSFQCNGVVYVLRSENTDTMVAAREIYKMKSDWKGIFCETCYERLKKYSGCFGPDGPMICPNIDNTEYKEVSTRIMENLKKDQVEILILMEGNPILDPLKGHNFFYHVYFNTPYATDKVRGKMMERLLKKYGNIDKRLQKISRDGGREILNFFTEEVMVTLKDREKWKEVINWCRRVNKLIDTLATTERSTNSILNSVHITSSSSTYNDLNSVNQAHVRIYALSTGNPEYSSSKCFHPEYESSNKLGKIMYMERIKQADRKSVV